MPEATLKNCCLALDLLQGPLLLPLTLATEATIETALVLARQQLQEQRADVNVDWERAAVGVWGERCGRDYVPRDGDRIELYRSLTADPRQRRRQRARAMRRA